MVRRACAQSAEMNTIRERDTRVAVSRVRAKSGSTGRLQSATVLARAFAAIVFLFAMIAATFLPSAIIPQSAFAVTPATTATAATVKSDDTTSVDYATWADVAKAVEAQLQEGLKEYKDGNPMGAKSDFGAAYTTVYVTSNFNKVVSDTIGADKQTAQQQAFQDL